MSCLSRAQTAGLLFFVSTLFGADLPYVGKWRLNPAKSNLAGTTITYTQQGAQLSYREGDQSYEFRADGHDYVTPFGYSAAWRRVDPRTVEMVAKLNNKAIQTDTLKFSADYKTMTVTSQGKRPSGEAWEDVTVYQRVSGTTGLAGKWKATKVTMNSLKQIEFRAFGSDGLTWTIADYEVTCSAPFDAKDYPVTGRSAPPGLTVSLKKTGLRAFELIEKKDRKPVYRATYTVSSDGKTLTEVGSSAAAGEKTTAVYDRQ